MLQIPFNRRSAVYIVLGLRLALRQLCDSENQESLEEDRQGPYQPMSTCHDHFLVLKNARLQ